MKMQGEIRISVREASIHQRTPTEERKASTITANIWLSSTPDGAFFSTVPLTTDNH